MKMPNHAFIHGRGDATRERGRKFRPKIIPPQRLLDGDAAPLMLSLGMALQTVVMLVVDVGGATRGLSLVLKFRHGQRECQHLV